MIMTANLIKTLLAKMLSSKFNKNRCGRLCAVPMGQAIADGALGQAALWEEQPAAAAAAVGPHAARRSRLPNGRSCCCSYARCPAARSHWEKMTEMLKKARNEEHLQLR